MMKKVFEPGEVELADPRGDPNRVITIQTKIKELLEANIQRQEGIFEELREEGAWALPGLLNSTYVWMNYFEENKPAQTLMAKILAELAKDNDSAISLLFDSGVLENPFKIPREIVLQALDELQWIPSKEQVEEINAQIRHQRKTEDIEGQLLSYKMLARSGDKKAFNTMLEQCQKWAEQNMKSGAELLGLLVKYYPESKVEILSDVITATKYKYKDKDLANLLIESLQPIPSEWWTDSTIINVSINVLTELSPPRHTAIEYLWTSAALDTKRNSTQFWMTNFENVNNLIIEAVELLDDDIVETISRYWFQSLGKDAYNFDIIVKSAFSESEPWGTSAASQLFFIRGGEHEKNRKNKDGVEGAISKLMLDNPSRYDRAEANYNTISSKNKIRSDVKLTPKAGGLK